jgi:O-phosphoseryl-tRNA(Sec) kinase
MQQTAALLTQNPNDPIIVIVDDNMYYRSMRRSYFKLARQCRSFPQLIPSHSPSGKVGFLTIFIECPLQLALTRNATRGTDQVKESVIQEMVTNFQPPSEAHQWEASHLKINAGSPLI